MKINYVPTRNVDRITLVVTAATLILLAMIYLSWYINDNLISKLSAIVVFDEVGMDKTTASSISGRKLHLCSEMIAVARNRARLLGQAINTQDPFVQDEISLLLDKEAGQFASLREELFTLPLTDKEKEILRIQAAAANTSLPKQREAIEKAIFGGEQGRKFALDTLYQIVYPSHEKIVTQLLMISTLALSDIEKVGGDYINATADTRRFNQTLIMAVMILGIALAIVVVRYIQSVQSRLSHAHHEIKESFDIYQAAINTPALGFWVVDSQGEILEVNLAYGQQSGYGIQELIGMPIGSLEATLSPEEIEAKLQEVKTLSYSRFRGQHRRKDGSLWPVEVVTTYSPIQGGRYFAFFEDLTETIEREQKLELAARVLDTMTQAVVITDPDANIISINPAATEITGYTLEEIKGATPSIFSSGQHDNQFYAQMWSSLLESGYWEGEIWDRKKDGAVYPKWLNIKAVYDTQGKVVQYVSIFSDISERKKSEDLIWKQANFDPLTGLANRVLFQSNLIQELTLKARDGGGLAVMFLDLDGFKDVNDSYGHAAGDELLKVVADRLKECARETDTVARLGGDEFTLLINSFDHAEQIGSLAERVLERLQAPILIRESAIHIGASIGIAIYPDDGSSAEELTKHADIAMYQAKVSGKNTFKFFLQEMNLKAITRLEMIHELHEALDRMAFRLYFQPKRRLLDQKVVGMEALLRWSKGDGQTVLPGEFIPLTEETGLIIPIGHWVLTEACRQTQRWNRQYNAQLMVAINLSAKQFRINNLVESVIDALEDETFPASLLEIEITESMLMENLDESIAVMSALREKGISVAIDDFGTGYSSLNHLKHFPINTLKIDRSFVNELTEGREDAAIVHSIIALGKQLGLQVVAEGVESEEQIELLLSEQCDIAQGYYLGKPMSIDEFEDYLIRNRGDLIQ